MGNFGMGLGSFMDGLVKGASFRRQIDRDKLDAEMAQKRLDLAMKQDERAAAGQTFSQDMQTKEFGLRQDQAARAAKMDDFNLGRAKSEQAFVESERVANSPIEAAKRRSVLGSLNDAEAQRSSLKAAGAESDAAYEKKKASEIIAANRPDGSKSFSVGGKTFASKAEADAEFEKMHGTAMDAYRANVVPKIERMKVEAGDLAGAEAWRKWNDDVRVRKGVDAAGRLEMAFRSGDWDSVNSGFKAVMGNKDYMAQDGFDVKSEPIKDDQGRTVGIKGSFTDKKTGNVTTKEYKDLDALHTELMGMINPATVFEHNTKQLAAKREAEAKIAEDMNRTANQITVERAKRGMGAGVTQEEYAKGVMEVFKQLYDARAFIKQGPDGNPTTMTPDEQMAMAEERYRALLARSALPSQIAPQRRPVLFSRPASAPSSMATGTAAATMPLAAPKPAAADEEE